MSAEGLLMLVGEPIGTDGVFSNTSFCLEYLAEPLDEVQTDEGTRSEGKAR